MPTPRRLGGGKGAVASVHDGDRALLHDLAQRGTVRAIRVEADQLKLAPLIAGDPQSLQHLVGMVILPRVDALALAVEEELRRQLEEMGVKLPERPKSGNGS